jgi:hypothetical protein
MCFLSERERLITLSGPLSIEYPKDTAIMISYGAIISKTHSNGSYYPAINQQYPAISINMLLLITLNLQNFIDSTTKFNYSY